MSDSANEETGKETPVAATENSTEALKATSSADVSSDDKTMAILAHALPIIVGFWAPLLIWILKKDSSSFIDAEGKEALNFQISLFIYYSVCILLTVIIIGAIVLPFLWIFSVVVMVMAALQVNKGGGYKYPLCIRLIK